MLGFDTVEEYRANARLHFSATIGRVTGRIRDARFEFEGREVILPGPTSIARAIIEDWFGDDIDDGARA